MMDRQLIECHLRDGLAMILGGETEVRIDGIGRADLVTDSHVYEVKALHDWMHAIGQSTVYGVRLGRRPGIALFGDYPGAAKVQAIAAISERLNVDLLWHFFDDTGEGFDALPIPEGAWMPDIEIRRTRKVARDPAN